MFNILRWVFKRRRHARYVVQDGIYVIVSPDTEHEHKVQVVDISKGGMGFIYQGSPEDLEASGVLKILSDAPNINKVKFETVSDIPAPGSGKKRFPFRRRGVKFKWMGVFEQTQLSDLIKKIGITEK